jgi:AbrB family looped-hinge helix DNA binding protein
MSTVTIKGQATIPKNVRDFLGITPGKSNVEFIIRDGHVEVINNDKVNPFAAAKGITKGKLSTNDIMEMTRG